MFEDPRSTLMVEHDMEKPTKPPPPVPSQEDLETLADILRAEMNRRTPTARDLYVAQIRHDRTRIAFFRMVVLTMIILNQGGILVGLWEGFTTQPAVLADPAGALAGIFVVAASIVGFWALYTTYRR